MRWPAPTERPWALHGKRKRHFSEFSSEAARSDGGGIPAAATPTHGEQARPGGAAGEASTQGERQRRQRASTESFCVFLFWGEGVETRCSCCRPPTLCSDKVSRNQRQRSGNRLRRTKAAHRGKPATADNRPPAKLTGAKDQRKPCGALFANVVETGGAGRCTGIATPEPTSNSGRRCVGQFGGCGSAPAARERLQRRTALPGRSASGARTGAGGGDL